MSVKFYKPQKKLFTSQIFHFDKTLFLLILGLSLFGLLAIFNSSSVTAFHDFGNQYHYVQDQFKFLVIGVIALLIISQINYKIWYKLSIPLLFLNLILLICVFIPGIGVNVMGAKRWLNFGFTTLQPTELTKLTFVIYLSAWFAHKEKGRLLPFLVLVGSVLGLVILQPDMGTAIIITGIAAILYFISGVPLKHILILLPIFLGSGLLTAILAPYRFKRIITFLNHTEDPMGASYHFHQILIALGSGGLFGLGLGKSRQKYAYLPEASTDSIFAVIAEEIGFIGSVILILIFLFITLRAFRIGANINDRFGQLLAYGIGIWFAVQTVINLSAMVGLVPLTGVPLPLISYGGSNYVSLMIGFGILLNISKHQKIKA